MRQPEAYSLDKPNVVQTHSPAHGLAQGCIRRGGGGFGWDPPSSQGPRRRRAKIFKRKSS